nr:MAG TPA: terminase large subunit [Caudoviricetes sp.]
MTSPINVSLPSIVGGGYGTFWRWQGRYRVVKGSRASKKSATMALWCIVSMIKYPDANLLVVRKTYRTLKDSCFAQLKWAMRRLGVEQWFKCTESPLEITYRPTGQKILFRGLDDPLKVTSVTVDVGALCFLWIEEAYEVMSEDDFDRLDESIRGILPDGLYHQVTLTLNPWSDRHWIKKRFFDEKSPNVLAMTTNYMCNEFLGPSDLALFEEMKKNPKRYKVAGLGEWGAVDGLVYENWKEQTFTIDEVRRLPGAKAIFGLDFGYTTDPTAFFCGIVDKNERRLYVFDELYERGLTNRAIADKVKRLGYAKETIIADCAEPKSIAELREFGLPRVRASKKGADSILNGVQRIQDYEIIVHPRCVNFLTEISQYQWEKDRFGKYTGKPEDDNNHLMDAMRYAFEPTATIKGGNVDIY